MYLQNTGRTIFGHHDRDRECTERTVTCSASMAAAAANTFVRRPTLIVRPIVSFFAAFIQKFENMKFCRSQPVLRGIDKQISKQYHQKGGMCTTLRFWLQPDR